MIEITPTVMVIFASVGVIAGFLNTVAGGGSMITVPIMIFLGIPASVANGTNRIPIIAQSFTATYFFFKKQIRDLKESLFMATALLPGSIIGAIVASDIETSIFKKILSLVIGLSIFFSVLSKKNKKFFSVSQTNNTVITRKLTVYGLLLILGFYGGFIHIGIGFLIMFTLNKIGRLGLAQTNMHKVIIVVPYSIVCLAIFAEESEIIWEIGLILAFGNMIGAWFGAKITLQENGKYVAPIFQLSLVVVMISLLFT